MKRLLSAKVAIIILAALVLGFFDLPFSTQKSILPSAPEALGQLDIHLGLDLQGGTQLDYKIDLRKVPNEDRANIIEGVKDVINRRVNSLGVSEPNIYTSKIANEQHIIVELAGVQDLDEAKKSVGKTIQLEFKEERTAMDPNQKEEIRSQAQTALNKLLANPEQFDLIGEEEQLAYPSRVEITNEDQYFFPDEVSTAVQDIIFDHEASQIIPELIETTEEDSEYFLDAFQQLKTKTGFSIYKIIDQIEEERTIKNEKEVQASHILFAYQGAERTSEGITRTQEEAKTRAEEVYTKVQAEEDFATLAEEYSDCPSASSGGDLGFFSSGQMTKKFEDVTFKMEIGEISNIVETEFGYHIIKVTDTKEALEETRVEPKVKFHRIFYSTIPDSWKETGLTGEHFKHADVQMDQNSLQPYVSIQFNTEGGKLFEEITARNIEKPVAIFVGGDLISSPRVREKISGGSAQISGNFSLEEATSLARDLNTGAIPAPILLSGQYTIGATLGQDALQKSIKAGLLGLLMLALYMILYYRLPGLLANVALFVYATILLFFIKIALPLWLAVLVAAVMFVFILMKIMQSDDPGLEKMVSFLLACFILFFLTFLLHQPIVLTLAGIAGVILSIGMAIDANVLIFERIKEELKSDKPLSTAIEIGFNRAWSSIRDSNFSSLITCGILYYFGTSIIRGFALTLAMGILISMFTAITITRTLLRASSHAKATQNPKLYLPLFSGKRQFQIIKNSRIWFTLSGILITLTIIFGLFFNVKWGLDFTGGTLMEFKFTNPEITVDQIKTTLVETEKELKDQSKIAAAEIPAEPSAENPETTPAPATDSTIETTSNLSEESLVGPIRDTAEPPEAENPEMAAPPPEPITEIPAEQPTENPIEEIPIDFGKPVVVPTSEGNFIVRIKHISNETHDFILAKLQTQFGDLEEPRFTTVGPTIGSTLKRKAGWALGIALVMMVLYIAFAFRKVPKHINPWRFGFCAIAALVHDVLIVSGAFILLGTLLHIEIDALFITALLTIIGFSVHDTIVVFDRLRENLKFQQRGETFDDVANKALNQTIGRSINTSLTTLFTLTALFAFGSLSIKYFVLALIIGVLVGTYSSIFTATPLLVAWKNWKQQK